MTEENNDRLKALLKFKKYKEFIVLALQKVISRSYIDEGYCFMISEILIETIIKINKITLDEANEYIKKLLESED